MKVLHHNDADGRCAAAIVRYSNAQNGTEFIEMDYAKIVPFDRIDKDENIFIVDFSFKPEDMNKVLEITKNITWIDHHATAKDYPYQGLKGLRDFTNKGLSGCELTWKYCCPLYSLPESVALIGDYDSWRMEKRPDCLEFYEGLKMQDQNPLSRLWPIIFADYIGGFEGQNAGIKIDEIKKDGRAAIKYRDMYCADLRKSFGFDCTLEYADGLKCYALNAYKFGSQAYGELMQCYDVLIGFIFDGVKVTVSLYSEKPEVDVSIIAKKLGGGGHKGAAGFVVNTNIPLPFKKEGVNDDGDITR